MMFVAALVGISNLFIYCYYGQMATEYFRRMSNCLYQSKWEALPVDLQKYFVVLIGNTQKPIHYHGFRIAVLNLETFLTVSQLKLEKNKIEITINQFH